MKLSIFTKSNNIEGQAKQKELADFFADNGIDCLLLETKDCENLSENSTNSLLYKLQECDAMVVFGGDGTVLRAVALTCMINLPILSVNIGDMGFLAELEITATPAQILDAVKTFQIENSTLLKVTDGEGHSAHALNDIVLKAEGETPVYITAKVQDEALDRYRSDGVIVSTPTGSTAYALSAGGPILAPDVNGMVIIPICPHTLHSRPAVLSLDSKIELILEKSNESANLIVDGKLITKINSKQKLIITKSSYTASFLRKTKSGFYTRLLQKMNLWGVSNG